MVHLDKKGRMKISPVSHSGNTNTQKLEYFYVALEQGLRITGPGATTRPCRVHGEYH